nr:hypothetical protein [Dechloromonas sp.]
MALVCQTVLAQQPTVRLRDVNVRDQANGVLTLMTFTLVPDVTTSALSITSASSGNPSLTMGTLGGGATMSRDVPIYLEGTLGYSRYDPKFLASDGIDQTTLPLRWNSVSLSGGIGWDFRFNDELVLRPIFMIALGRVMSDLEAGEFLVNRKLGTEFNFIRNGSMDAYGLGGSLMLDWERIRPEYEADLEARYTHIELQTFGNSENSVKGSSAADSINVWARYRAPTGLVAFERPVRYVLEAAHSRFFGDQKDALGFDAMNSLGLGMELDVSAYETFISRIRLVARRMFGDGVRGSSLGLAISF